MNLEITFVDCPIFSIDVNVLNALNHKATTTKQNTTKP